MTEEKKKYSRIRKAQKYKSRETGKTEKQKSKEAGKAKSRKAEKQEKQRSRESEKQRSRKAEQEEKAEKQKSSKSEKQESIEPGKNKTCRKKKNKINSPPIIYITNLGGYISGRVPFGLGFATHPRPEAVQQCFLSVAVFLAAGHGWTGHW
jgi:hypothetical protein